MRTPFSGFSGAALALVLALPTVAHATDARRAPFGALADGQPVEAITLSNSKGMRARVINYGAILQSVEVPDRGGRTEDVVLGYADMHGYLTSRRGASRSMARPIRSRPTTRPTRFMAASRALTSGCGE
jgi:hypothetical protein